MSDLMLEIIKWVILIVVIVFGTLLLFLIVYDYFSTNVKKKELKLKKYEINYNIYEYASKCHIRAKNKKQAIKDFHKWIVRIHDVKEVE